MTCDCEVEGQERCHAGDDCRVTERIKRSVDRVVMPHQWGIDEGGFRLCINCGTAEHKKPYQGFHYWLTGIGCQSDPGCR